MAKQQKNQTFKKYYSRLAREGIFKSLIGALIAGFAAVFVAAAVTWFIEDFDGLWLSIGVGAGVGVITGFLLYFKRFRPTAKTIAERVDRLGLEERLITMLELEEDESYIALRQRDDAKAHIDRLPAKSVKFAFSRAALIVMAALVVCGTGMAVVTGLSDIGVIASGGETIENLLPTTYVTVNYLASEGAYIEGDETQIIEAGTSTEEVTVVADEGFAFVSWTDGYEYPTRSDVTDKDLDLSVYLVQLEEGDEDEEDTDGTPEEGEEGDDSEGEEAPEDIPTDVEGSSDSENDDTGDNPSGGTTANGVVSENDKIIDGETDYRDVMDYEYLMAQLQSNDNLTDEEKAQIEAWLELLKLYGQSSSSGDSGE